MKDTLLKFYHEEYGNSADSTLGDVLTLMAYSHGVDLVVELGVRRAKTTRILATVAKRVVGVDLFEEIGGNIPLGHTLLAAQETMRGIPVEKWALIQSDTRKAAHYFDDECADILFVDGDHSYEGVRADIDAWWPKVKVGGHVLFHDNYEAGVRRVIDELLKAGVADEIIALPSVGEFAFGFGSVITILRRVV